MRFGDYEILNEIARGGTATVYRARQTHAGRVVALKVLSREAAGLAGRFHTEVEAVTRLDHPNIVPIYDVGEHEGWIFLAMRLVEGRTLADALAHGALPFHRAARVIATTARAIQHAHDRGVLHRDLKPANILLDASDEPHVADFGLARFTHRPNGLTPLRTALGTPAYMSPEQAEGRVESISAAADVYGLGAVLFETLTGSPLFSGESAMDVARQVIEREPARPSTLDPAIPADLEVICLRCLEKDPAHRYPAPAAVADDLERWLRKEPIVARPRRRWRKLERWSRCHPCQLALTAATVLALAGAGLGASWQHRRMLEVQRTAARPVALPPLRPTARLGFSAPWLAWFPDRKRQAIGTAEGRVLIWNSVQSRIEPELELESLPSCGGHAAVSNDGRWVALVNRGQGIDLWEASTGRLHARTNLPVSVGLLAFELGPQAETVIQGASQGLWIWRPLKHRLDLLLTTQQRALFAVCDWSRHRVMVALDRGDPSAEELIVIDLETGNELDRPPGPEGFSSPSGL